ncbi:nicotinamide-nucleotide amidohydrolase family protein [Jiangella aurantiaca]|uniref:Nicotinamide-nucleotide amidohydrolase family protein n=1 Tax=Jiangella aurantiaca TaxID=2530373 RepID=A0A4R5AAN5_9ACTN|nr:nicotinamide-nucleotide amidohydrolase family protein [Jiangella aurantiaca]TDD68755.1 nicotinamide-nucleotide amidohydrolase family protein [Jiangella aurantiaca]
MSVEWAAGGDGAADVVRRLKARGLTVAAAESLTGGLVCAALTSVPGSSAVVRGGVVVYATELKATLAGVPEAVLAADGPVAASTAVAMADGVRRRLGADVGLATTGVAGPDPQDGHPPGTVHVAVATAGGARVRSFTGEEALPGGREQVRAATVGAVLALLSEV